MRLHSLFTLMLVVLLAGCQAVSTAHSERKEAREALSVVAGAVSGKSLTDEELRNLEEQILEDEGAQSAVQAIAESVGGKAPVVKYCPVTGERYAPHIEICPKHNVPLEIVDP